MRVYSIVFLIGVLSCCACQQEGSQPMATAVEVTEGPLVVSTSFFGEVEAADSVPIHAPNVSLVDAFTVESVLSDGTEVHEGDVVLSFVRGPVEDELRSRKADLEVTLAVLRRERQRLDKKQIELQLAVELATMKVREAELELVACMELAARVNQDKAEVRVQKAQVDLDSAREVLAAFDREREIAIEVKALGVARAQAEYDEAEELLQTLDVQAPAAGVVYAPYTNLNWVRSKVRPGSVVRPGDKLLEIPDLGSFVARVYVRQREASLVEVGDRMVVTASVAPGQPMAGEVTEVEEFATTRNERLGTETAQGELKEVHVTVALEGVPANLRPGATVRADFEKTLADGVVVLPLTAVSERDGQPFVEVVGRGRSAVELGASSISQVEVLDGLSAGERVLLESMDGRLPDSENGVF